MLWIKAALHLCFLSALMVDRPDYYNAMIQCSQLECSHSSRASTSLEGHLHYFVKMWDVVGLLTLLLAWFKETQHVPIQASHCSNLCIQQYQI